MSRERGLTTHQEIVQIDDVPPEDLLKVLAALIEHLNVVLIREQTPDYTVYEVWQRD